MKTLTRVLGIATVFWLSLSLSGVARASSEELSNETALSYIISFPTGATSDFVGGSASFRGIGVESMQKIPQTDIVLGLSFRWVYFQNNQDDQTYTLGSATITGRLYRSVDSVPLMIHGRYMIPTGGHRLSPYVGLGVGALYGRQELDIGPLGQTNIGWQFAMAPEVGAVFYASSASSTSGDTFGGPPGVMLNIRYDLGFGTGSLSSINYLSIAFGLTSRF